MYEFLTIVILIFGILQIFLFFKLWGMTNNVSKISKRMEMNDEKTLDVLIMSGQIDESESRIKENLSIKLSRIYNEKTEDSFIKEARVLIEKYDKLMKAIGRNLPPCLSSAEEFVNTKKLINSQQ